MPENTTNEFIKINKDVCLYVKQTGSGYPILLLHGYPQTHLTWHRLAPLLSKKFTVVMPDLRGYGDSSKPTGPPDHSNYSKRAMAYDQVELMSKLGFNEFIRGYPCGL